MGSTRIKVLDIDDTTLYLQFGSYALLMYYASTVDEIKAGKIFYATITEYWFRKYNNMSTDGMDSDEETAHFDSADLQEVILFINNELIPALEAETQDLFVKYGGLEKFLDLFSSQKNFLQEIWIYEDEYFDTDPESIIFHLNNLKEIFTRSLALNRSYIVYFD